MSQILHLEEVAPGAPKTFSDTVPGVVGPFPGGHIAVSLSSGTAYIRISNDGSIASDIDFPLPALALGGFYQFSVRRGDSISFRNITTGDLTAYVTMATAVA
jgi:hypothetical protein